MEEGKADPEDSLRRLAIYWHKSHLHSTADSADALAQARQELGDCCAQASLHCTLHGGTTRNTSLQAASESSC